MDLVHIKLVCANFIFLYFYVTNCICCMRWFHREIHLIHKLNISSNTYYKNMSFLFYVISQRDRLSQEK